MKANSTDRFNASVSNHNHKLIVSLLERELQYSLLLYWCPHVTSDLPRVCAWLCCTYERLRWVPHSSHTDCQLSSMNGHTLSNDLSDWWCNNFLPYYSYSTTSVAKFGWKWLARLDRAYISCKWFCCTCLTGVLLEMKQPAFMAVSMRLVATGSWKRCGPPSGSACTSLLRLWSY